MSSILLLIFVNSFIIEFFEFLFWVVKILFRFWYFVAIVIVKQLFGGLGQNFANPAITARVILLVAFGVVGKQVFPVMSEIVSGATPLSVLKNSDAGQLPSLFEMFDTRGG